MNRRRAAVSDKFSVFICLKDAAVARAMALNGGITGEAVFAYGVTAGLDNSV